jgi:uncharacterized protein (TIGR00297 family)
VIQAVAGILLASCIAIVSFRLRWLTKGGAIAQFALGALLFGLGGVPWAAPVIVFFVSSSLLSMAFRGRRGSAATHHAKGSRRDAVQVIANGGVGGVLVLILAVFDVPHVYAAYVASFAAAAADTWATEIGTVFRGMPRLIIGLRKVERGRSGAVSLRGTIAAALGSLTVSASSLPWIAPEDRWPILAIAGIGGLFGSCVDSVLGASIQGQWYCPRCGRTVEMPLHCEEKALPSSGFSFVTNDLVNLISIGSAAALAWWAFSCFLASS